MGRAPCCDKANVKKGPWSPEEDAKLKEFIEKHGTGGNWIVLPKKAGKLSTSHGDTNHMICYHLHHFLFLCLVFMTWFVSRRFEKMWQKL